MKTTKSAFPEKRIMNRSSPISRWQKKLEHEICRLEKKMCLRELRPHSGRIDFSSNDYLSLNANGLIKKLLQEQLENWEKEFVGSTGSRLLSGHYEAFTRLEEHFSQKIGVRSSLFFSSGYAANTGTLSAILGPRDTAFCDRLCHASLLDGLRLSQPHRCYFRHNDLEDLENKLKYYSSKRGRRSSYWIIAEAVYSMDGDSHDLVALCDLAERYEACIYLDEAHSVGVRGGGAGLAQETGVLERIAVSVFPCGKAIGLMGAFVCGPEALKTVLINKARSFVYSTAPLPLLAPLLFSVLDLVFSKKWTRHVLISVYCLRIFALK